MGQWNFSERYKWLDFIRLDQAMIHGAQMRFHYAGNERLPYAMTRNGTNYGLHYDQVGSLRVVADVNGNVISEIMYDSFGNIIEQTNPSFIVPLGLAGGLHDQDTNWVRFGWRDYDPRTGRFTAPDPIGLAGGDSDVYGYCLDDPVNGVDPLGLWTEVHHYDDNKGHVAVALEGDDPVGKYPKASADIFGGQGEYRKETREPARTVHIDTTKEQEANMREYLDMAGKSTSVGYSLYIDNCVKATDDVLEVGGIQTPNSTGRRSPGSYFEELDRLHNK